MTDTLRIKNWETWQSYRKDRGTPPWIKIHRNLMSNPEWAILDDAEKGQLVSIWIVAADRDGEVSADAKILRKICMLDDEPNINKFIELGFIEAGGCQLDTSVTPTGCQRDAPETETETDKRKDKKKKPAPKKFVLPDFIPPSKWTDYLESRKQKKHPMNPASLQLAVNAITKTMHAGHSIDRIMDSMIEAGWRSVKPEWIDNQDSNNASTNRNSKKSEIDWESDFDLDPWAGLRDGEENSNPSADAIEGDFSRVEAGFKH